MGLETGTYINSLNSAWPLGTDAKSAGDDHLRLIKSTIKATFPNLTGAVTADQAELNKLDGLTASTAELNYLVGVTSAIQTQLNAKAALAVEQTWTAQQTPMGGSATATTSADWNCDTTGQIYDLTVGTTDFTMNAPTNVNNRAFYTLRVTQHGTTPRVITWNAAYKFPGGIDPELTATAGAVDVFTFIGASGNTMHCVGVAKDLA